MLEGCVGPSAASWDITINPKLRACVPSTRLWCGRSVLNLRQRPKLAGDLSTQPPQLGGRSRYFFRRQLVDEFWPQRFDSDPRRSSLRAGGPRRDWRSATPRGRQGRALTRCYWNIGPTPGVVASARGGSVFAVSATQAICRSRTASADGPARSLHGHVIGDLPDWRSAKASRA